MTLPIHDQFAKDYLNLVLSPFGTVQPSRHVADEIREIDACLDQDDRELIMHLAPLSQQAIQQAAQQAVQQGIRLVVENILRVRFGELGPQLQTAVDAILTLPPEEFTPLLMQLSREEIIERFR
jgi:hypothetical protein